MSSASQPLSGSQLEQIQVDWQEITKPNFIAEIATFGEDLVYHFWPPLESDDLGDAFGIYLQQAFRWVFRNQPKDADGYPKVDIRASYTSLADAKVMRGMGTGVPAPAVTDRGGEPLATFHVKVVGWGNNPLADHILRDKLLDHLNDLVKPDVLQEDLPRLERSDDVAEREPPRRRRRRRRKLR